MTAFEIKVITPTEHVFVTVSAPTVWWAHFYARDAVDDAIRSEATGAPVESDPHTTTITRREERTEPDAEVISILRGVP